MAAEILKPNPNVGLNVLHQMADMDRPVGVGERAGDQDASWSHGGRKCIGANRDDPPEVTVERGNAGKPFQRNE
ncbi:hypothetical protein JCM17478_33460 [Thermopirellula anaerolimosa]